MASPKKILKLKSAGSEIEAFAEGLTFAKVIEDKGKNMAKDDKIRRVVFCSGQVYYDLDAERAKLGVSDIAIVRVEQLAPFPFKAIEQNL